MSLIDADNIEFSCQYEGECTADKESCKRCDDYVCNFREVQSLRTAYDVDKVVEQFKTDSLVKLYGSGDSDNYLIPVKRAIEIVKAGGIDER